MGSQPSMRRTLACGGVRNTERHGGKRTAPATDGYVAASVNVACWAAWTTRRAPGRPRPLRRHAPGAHAWDRTAPDPQPMPTTPGSPPGASPLRHACRGSCAARSARAPAVPAAPAAPYSGSRRNARKARTPWAAAFPPDTGCAATGRRWRRLRRRSSCGTSRPRCSG